ncbi:MAG: hypothetical protein WCK73_00220 [Deltaproteobacteria bacterium]
MKTILGSLLVVLALSSFAFAQQSTSNSGTGAQGPSGPARSGGPRTPPPEAVAACSGKSAGAACTFQHKERTETGTCFTPDASMPVACKPARAPRDDSSAPATR